MHKRLIIILLLNFLLLPETVVPSTIQNAYWPNQPLSKGTFLVANPMAMGPYFTESVVLIVEYSYKKGAKGIIINRPAGVSLTKVLPDLKWLDKKPDTLFIGGPVSRFSPLTLLRINKKIKNSNHIFNNVYYSHNMETLKKIIKNKDQRERVRVYAGYSGWASGQLEAEIHRGSWKLLKADQYTIFDKDPRNIWKDLISGNSQLMAKKPGKDKHLLKNYEGPLAQSFSSRFAAPPLKKAGISNYFISKNT